MAQEIWRDVAGFEGFYQVSNLGRVRSVEHMDAINHKHPSRVIRQRKERTGYMRVHFSMHGVGSFHHVHRLVAAAFVEKPDGCNVVNHIDNDRTNNRAENLEWTTYSGNMQWAGKQGRMRGNPDNLKAASERRKIPVIVTDKDGYQQMFESGADAARALNLPHNHIAACCRKDYGYKTIGGFSFEYADSQNQS